MSGDRLSVAWLLACLVGGLALVVIVGRLLGRRPAHPAATPAEELDEDDPVCRTRGCTLPATRALPELRSRRQLGLLVPSWEVVDDPDAEVALCRAHHGVWTAALVQRAAQERAALEEHLAVRHAAVVAHVAGELPRALALAPPAVPLRPSPLRGATLPPLAAAAPPEATEPVQS